MVEIKNLSVQFGSHLLFDSINIKISAGDKIGIIGNNGVGKSTLIKLISESANSSDKNIIHQKGVSIGYLKQVIEFDGSKTVWDSVVSEFVDISVLRAKVENLQDDISRLSNENSISNNSKLFEELELSVDELNQFEHGPFHKNLELTLLGLGFTRSDFNRAIGEFSGGWKMRVELAKLLMADHDILLLDEPTNHLDLDSIIWLENFLKMFSGSFLLISHDKEFLNNTTNRTILIKNSGIVDYKLNYSEFIKKIELDATALLSSAQEQDKFIKRTEELINKFRAKKNKASFAQSLIKKLDKLDKIEIDSNLSRRMSVDFPLAKGGFKLLIEIEDLFKSFDSNVIFKGVDWNIVRGEKIALVGKNGIGKSTLLKIIMGQELYEGKVRVLEGVKIGYFAQNETEKLDGKKTVLAELDEDIPVGSNIDARSLLGAFLFSKDDVDKRVSVLSGGEKMRLALCKMIIKPVHLLILDEPTNHLDIEAKEVLKGALQNFRGTTIVVSHDREFLSGYTNCIIEIYDRRLRIHQNLSFDEFLDGYGLNNEKGIGKKSESSNKIKGLVDGKKSEGKLKRNRSKEIRTLERLISKGEVNIEKIEFRIKEIEDEMSNGSNKENFNWSHYSTLLESQKIELNEAMKDWEKNNIKLDEIKKEQ